ncbi:DsrE family protein [Confluentibacter flavum]|uniref:Uncharacterized protein n=1 Tax=Confluentibacter flavum TaxID=1909700 RepID=A0A2N3HN81_9FLAO|nr:DsrE family protein [Confluentibacter flavum]PKQ46420.1 hypothetical protein CSW08_03135 [Confluentibacter flavum]
MKSYLNLILACLITSAIFAQEKPVKIVFDVTSDDPSVHKSTVRHVKAMSEAYPDSEFEVVMYSGAMDMVLKNKSVVADDIANLVQKDNVDFVICEGTMKRYNTASSDLIAGVKSVPDGILEIIVKQKEGWGYIKESK